MGVSQTTAQEIPTGALTIALVDQKINQLVWKGEADAQLGDNESNAQLVQDAITQMFAQFPPKAGVMPGANHSSWPKSRGARRTGDWSVRRALFTGRRGTTRPRARYALWHDPHTAAPTSPARGSPNVKLNSRSAISTVAGALALVVLAACSSVTVNTDWNSSIDFSQYKTFAWLPDTVDKDLEAVRAPAPHCGDHGGAGEALALKSVTADPQLYVTYRAKRSSTTQYTTVSTGYGYGAGWGGWGYYGGYGYGGVGVSTTSQQQIPTGNLIVVLVDPSSTRWSGARTRRPSSPMITGARVQQPRGRHVPTVRAVPPEEGPEAGGLAGRGRRAGARPRRSATRHQREALRRDSGGALQHSGSVREGGSTLPTWCQVGARMNRMTAAQ